MRWLSSWNTWRLGWFFALILFSTGGLAVVLAEEEVKKSVESNKNGCLVDAASLDDLRKQRLALDARETEMKKKESEVEAREKSLQEEMKKMVSLREEIGLVDAEKKKAFEAQVAKLVETVEAMNPKSASALIATLEERLAIQVMSRLSTLKLSKVLNLMDVKRASLLSEGLAGVVRAKNQSPSREGAEATREQRQPATQPSQTGTAPSEKGGEKT